MTESKSDREISTTRVVDAPRELVWKVWTDPHHIVEWWGPRGFTNINEEMDVRPGGIWRFVMHGPDGVDYPNRITYLEVKKPERLMYDHGDDENPKHFRVLVTFEEVDGKTRISMCLEFKSAEDRNEVARKHGAVEGLNQNMDKLSEYLAALPVHGV